MVKKMVKGLIFDYLVKMVKIVKMVKMVKVVKFLFYIERTTL